MLAPATLRPAIEARHQRFGVGIAEAERGEFSTLSVMEIAATVLAEDDEGNIV